MKINFKKITAIATSVLMVGMTMGVASAASIFPLPYSSSTSAGVAIVSGTGADVDDLSARGTIATYLANQVQSEGSVAEGGEGVTEDEVVLGATIAVNKLSASLTDSKIASLLDTKFSWDDGGASGADDYHIHEEVLFNGNMYLKTTLDDNDYTENVALTNDKGLEYRYVFETALNVTAVGTTNADTLYLTILGKEYEIESMSTTTLSVTTSDKVSLSVGGSYTTDDGIIFTVGDIYSDQVEVNGELIATSATKKIDGKRVKVESIGYHSNSPELSKTILKIGDDISKTFSDGEEYVGEDEDDPLWVWHFGLTLGEANAYIGVQYNQKETRDTDDVVYEGGSYVLPEDYAAVQFDGLTDVSYSDFKVYFDDSEDLWNSTDVTSTAQTQDAKVVIIEAVDGSKDAIKLTDDKETNKMYIYWANASSGTESDVTNGSLEWFYSDVNGDVSDAIKPRYSNKADSTDSADGTVGNTDLGDLIVGDSTISITAKVSSSGLTLNFTDGSYGESIILDIGGIALISSTGELKWFGGDTETTSKETAEAGDIVIGTTNVGTYDNDIMTYNGLIAKTPEAHADNDEVHISVPDDRVYGIVSVLGGITVIDDEVGSMVFLDSETGWQSRNVILVGGSCINSATATALGHTYPTCESAWESATGVGDSRYLIKSVGDAFTDGKIALVVAGYNQADTAAAASNLVANPSLFDTAAGNEYIYQVGVTGSSTKLSGP